MQSFQYRLIMSAFLFISSLVHFTVAAEIQERDVCEPAVVARYQYEYPVLFKTYISASTIINVGGIEININNAPTSLSTKVTATVTTIVPALLTTTSPSTVPPSPAQFRIISSGSSIDITYLFAQETAYGSLSRKRDDSKRQPNLFVSAVSGSTYEDATLFSFFGEHLGFFLDGQPLLSNLDPRTTNIFFTPALGTFPNRINNALFSFPSDDGIINAVEGYGALLQTQLCERRLSTATFVRAGCSAMSFIAELVATPHSPIVSPAVTSSTQLSSDFPIEQPTTASLQSTQTGLSPPSTQQEITQSASSYIPSSTASSEPSGTPGPPIGPNIVANGAFDASIDGWVGFQSVTDPTSGNSIYSWAPDSVSEPAHSPGGGQMKINLTGAQNVTGVTRVGFGSSDTNYMLDFIPDDSYYLTSWYRADGNSTTSAADLDGCFVYIQPENDFTRQESSNFPLSADWTEAVFNFTGNATQSRIAFTLYFNHLSNAINLYLGDVVIQASTI